MLSSALPAGRQVRVPTWGRCVRRRSLSLSDSFHDSAVNDSATPILPPMVLPCRDFEATRGVGRVGRGSRLPRDATAGAREDPPSPRPVVVRLRRAGCERSRGPSPPGTAGSRGCIAAEHPPSPRPLVVRLPPSRGLRRKTLRLLPLRADRGVHQTADTILR
jgi:hypothetical protein